MRGKNGGLQAVVPDVLLESSCGTQETMFHKKQTVQRVLVALPHLHGVGVWCNEDRMGKMGASDEELMSSLLGCRQFFPMPVDLLFGDISMYPHCTKNWPMSHQNLRLSPWRNIAGIRIGFKLEEHI
jgi:hypothetical protein